MRIPSLATLLLAPLGFALPAQTQNVAYLGNNQSSTSYNAFPWGSAGIRYQVIAPNSLLGNSPTVIQDLLIPPGRPPGGGPPQRIEIVYTDIEVRMGLTTATQPTTSWTTNNPSPTTVYRGPLRVQFEPGGFVALGLPNSYDWAPTSASDNLCIEVIIRGVEGQTAPRNFFFSWSDRTSTIQRAFLYDWVNNTQNPPRTGSGGGLLGIVRDSGTVAILGSGCAGSNNKVPVLGIANNAWPRLGGSLPVTLTDAPANTAALLFLGTNDRVFRGIPLPFDLAAVGAPGCQLYIDPLFPIATGTNPSGSASNALSIPNNIALFRSHATAGWMIVDPTANNFGWVTSSYMRFVIGR